MGTKKSKLIMKILIMIISLGLIVSCYKEKGINNISDTEMDYAVDSVVAVADSIATVADSVVDISDDHLDYSESQTFVEPEPIPEPVIEKQYAFVVFYAVNTMEGEEIYCSGIVEVPKNMSEDDEYKLLDYTQSQAMGSKYGTTVTGRRLEVYDTYAEASRTREIILGYN